MRCALTYWISNGAHRDWRRGLYWFVATLAIGALVLSPANSFAQRRGRGGGGGGGGGGARVQGGSGSGPTVQGGAAAQGGARVGGGAPGAQASGTAQGGATIQGGARVDGATAVGRVGGSEGAAVRENVAPSAAKVTAPVPGVNVPRVTTDGKAAVTAESADRIGRANIRASGDAAVATGAARISPSWSTWKGTQAQTQRQAFHQGFDAALRAQARANVGMNNWLAANPARATYWGGWGNNVRSNFAFGSSPFFNSNGWWTAQNIIGLTTGQQFYGSGYGYGGLGGWGYSPWMSVRPWTYWWGTPQWGTFGSMYGWNQPYYYDYGPSGNVVYSGNQVLVNGQSVGTPTDYAASAAELATVDPASLTQTHPEEWMALGTFSFALDQNEKSPPRVIQLAVNKAGLISGTMFNRETGKTYTVQGRIDKETQRAAFTIGNQTDMVLESGVYNLTQEQTPVLAHFGPNKTATYLFARLPEPEHEAAAATAAVPAPTDPIR